jgi:hypothetical protein
VASVDGVRRRAGPCVRVENVGRRERREADEGGQQRGRGDASARPLTEERAFVLGCDRGGWKRHKRDEHVCDNCPKG